MIQLTTFGDSFAGWPVGGDKPWTFTVPFTGWRLEGCAAFLAVAALMILFLAGVGVALSRKKEPHCRWTAWAVVIPVVGISVWIGKGTAAFLAILLGFQAIREPARMMCLPRLEAILLRVLAVLYPLTAWQCPNMMALAPVMVLVCALPIVVAGDTTGGVRRATLTGFASIWIPWSLTCLIVLWHDASLTAFAATTTDVAAWTGGTGLKRFAWVRRSLSPLSPNKTAGELVGAFADAVVILTLLRHITPGLVAAVDVGDVLGDLLESVIKRVAGVEDAGDWPPGFDGLLDRVDSPLLVLPLAVVLG